MDADMMTALMLLVWVTLGITGMYWGLKWKYDFPSSATFAWALCGPLALIAVFIHHNTRQRRRC
jgi:hypothetical protein